MKILALDTSDRQFSVAALVGDTVLAEIVWDNSSGAKQTELANRSGSTSTGVAVELFPMLKRLLAQVGWKLNEVELLGVAKGPGSFTGLRTGIVAAKTIAFAKKIPVQGANTLEAMANQLAWFLESTGSRPSNVKPLSVHCVTNAQRQQLFAAKFDLVADSNGRFLVQIHSPSKIFNRENWIEELSSGDWVTGTGLKPLMETLQNLPVKIAPQSVWPSLASSIGRIAYRDFQIGSRDDFWILEPLYFRPSYADEN